MSKLEHQPVIDKLESIRALYESSHGPFYLFAYVKPAESPLWDVLIAAPWLDDKLNGNYRNVVKSVQNTLTTDELLGIGGVVHVRSDSLVVDDIAMRFATSKGPVELRNDQIGRIALDRGYVLESLSGVASKAA
ncbi:MAG TPA: hypothetical protein VGK19_05875 [Capsulimonadaceae bacterium]|jgi:hypothetical protein